MPYRCKRAASPSPDRGATGSGAEGLDGLGCEVGRCRGIGLGGGHVLAVGPVRPDLRFVDELFDGVGAVVALRDLLPQGVSGTAATASVTPRSPARCRPGAVSVAVFSRTFDPVEAERQDRAMRALIGNDLCHG
jgi:hypothetical protein